MRETDPFRLLSKLPDPEPDPARLEAVAVAVAVAVAASARAAFQDSQSLSARNGAKGRAATGAARGLMGAFGGLVGRARWLLAIPAVTAALVVLALLPHWQAPDHNQASEPQLADQGHDPVPGSALPGEDQSAGRRLGMRPGGATNGATGTSPAPDLSGPDLSGPTGSGLTDRHVFGAVVIISHESEGRVTLSLQHGASEIPFDQRQLEDGIGFRLLDAFVAPREAEPDLLLVQSAIGDAVNWDAFGISAGAITLIPSLSRQIYDAADREAVRDRLAVVP